MTCLRSFGPFGITVNAAKCYKHGCVAFSKILLWCRGTILAVKNEIWEIRATILSIIFQKTPSRAFYRESNQIQLTRAGLGGEYYPLPDFCDNSRTVLVIDTNLAVPSYASIWHMLWKVWRNPLENLGKNDSFMTSLHAIFVQNQTNIQTATSSIIKEF